MTACTENTYEFVTQKSLKSYRCMWKMWCVGSRHFSSRKTFKYPKNPFWLSGLFLAFSKIWILPKTMSGAWSKFFAVACRWCSNHKNCSLVVQWLSCDIGNHYVGIWVAHSQPMNTNLKIFHNSNFRALSDTNSVL